jgi:hypothetical protein
LSAAAALRFDRVGGLECLHDAPRFIVSERYQSIVNQTLQPEQFKAKRPPEGGLRSLIFVKRSEPLACSSADEKRSGPMPWQVTLLNTVVVCPIAAPSPAYH